MHKSCENFWGHGVDVFVCICVCKFVPRLLSFVYSVLYSSLFVCATFSRSFWCFGAHSVCCIVNVLDISGEFDINYSSHLFSVLHV